MKTVVAILLFISAVTFATPKLTETVEYTDRPFEVGFSYKNLHPNQLPNFTLPLGVYGINVGFPLWGQSLQIQALIGSKLDFAVTLIEVGYRFHFKTPFITGYGVVGTHYLGYSPPTHRFFGGNAGMGLLVGAFKGVEAHLELKMYFQTEHIVSIGGGISYLF